MPILKHIQACFARTCAGDLMNHALSLLEGVMSQQLWLTFIVASLPVHFSPGPNNVLALSRSMVHGYKAAHLGSLGRYPAYLLIFLAAGFGLGALLAASPRAFAALKWAGALYLAWIGFKLLRSARSTLSPPADGMGRSFDRTHFIRGEFLVAIMNPKAFIFATAFYAQFVTPGQEGFAHLFIRMVAVSLTLECIAAGCFCLLGATMAGAVGRSSLLAWITRGLGAIMIGFGILLAAS